MMDGGLAFQKLSISFERALQFLNCERHKLGKVQSPYNFSAAIENESFGITLLGKPKRLIKFW